MSPDTGLERLVNACLFPGFAGEAPPEWILRAVDDGLGGVVLYGVNAEETGGRLERLSVPLRRRRHDLLVAVDEEGGDVTRLHYRTGSPVPGNLALGVVDDVELTRRVARAIGSELAAIGINWNYAPVVDVNSDPRNPVIGVRSFGDDPERVARHGAAFVNGLQSCGVAAAAKHFPGHGATRADSHEQLPVVDCDEETFRVRELAPFAAAVEAGVRSLMTAHVVFPALDALPATLSRRFLTEIVRGELGFDGVITTDALEMRAVADRWGIGGAAVRSLAAGADALLVGVLDGERRCDEIRSAVAEAIRSGGLPLERLEEAAARVARLAAWAAAPRPDAHADADAVGAEAARRALSAELPAPLSAPAVVVELRDRTNLAVGDAHWSLAEPLAACGLLAASAQVRAADAPVPEADGRPLVVVCRDARRSSWQPEWLRRALAARPDAVVVAIGLADDRALAGPAFVATHGASRASLEAAAEALTGSNRLD